MGEVFCYSTPGCKCRRGGGGSCSTPAATPEQFLGGGGVMFIVQLLQPPLSSSVLKLGRNLDLDPKLERFGSVRLAQFEYTIIIINNLNNFILCMKGVRGQRNNLSM